MHGRQTVSLTKLQAFADSNSFSSNAKRIQDERCNADLMYALFHRPESVMDRLLPGLMELIERKNSPDMLQSRLYREAKAYLLGNARASVRIKLFFVLVVVGRDEEAQKIIISGAKPGNLWGERYEQHFQTYLPTLAKIIDTTFNCPWSTRGEASIQNNIRIVLTLAEQYYMCT